MVVGEAIAIAVVVALIIAFIGTGSLRAELKTVQQATEANIYIKEGSFKLKDEQDIYLCKKVEKTAKPKQNQSN